MIASLLIPLLAVAEGEGTPEPPPAAVQTLPPPTPTAIPTQPPPPTAIPPAPTAVPPTAVPPTQPPAPAPAKTAPQPTSLEPEPTATVAPAATLAPSPTPSPTAVPSPTPSPTAIVWVNTDSLTVIDGASASSLKPGANATVTVRYNVTTPRTSTTIHAALSGDVQGWTISSASLADTDTATAKAVWTQTGAVQPGTSFDLPIVVTAPANISADQTVGLHIWSVAGTDRGQETGVAKITQPQARFTVIAAPTPTEAPVMDQSLVVEENEDGEDDGLIQDGGEDQESEASRAATPGVGTNATPNSDAGGKDGVASQESREGDGVPVARPQASPVADSDDAKAVEGQALDMGSAASPVASPVAETPSPTLVCDAGGQNTFDCLLNADRVDVSGGALAIDGPSGWSFSVDGAAVEPSVDVDLAQLDVDWEEPVAFKVAAAHVDGCVEPGTRQSASLDVNLLYGNADTVDVTDSLSLAAPASGPDHPTLGIQSLDFGTLTWDEDSWGSSEVTGRIRVSQDGCGLPESSILQVEVFGADPGMRIAITSVSVSGAGIVVVGSNGELTGAPVTIAMIESGFTGDAEVVVTFKLMPSRDVGPGDYQMEIRAKTIAVP